MSNECQKSNYQCNCKVQREKGEIFDILISFVIGVLKFELISKICLGFRASKSGFASNGGAFLDANYHIRENRSQG